ncbi:MAG: TauD/TfdA family dioxygenase [Pseudomonadota bacterium]
MSIHLEHIDSPFAWRVDDIKASDWVFELVDSDLTELETSLAKVRSTKDAETIESFELPKLGEKMREAARRLEDERGIALIRGVPVNAYDQYGEYGELSKVFWGLALNIGCPEGQDAAGHKLHHVRNVKAANFSGNSSVRAYETNVTIDFHSDGSDALMFLCRRKGKSGGVNRLVSAVTAFNDVLDKSPELATVLQAPFAFDARGQREDGAQVQWSPIFTYDRGKLACLYKRGYIHLAQRFNEVPQLTDLQKAAMDALDAAFNDPRNAIEVELEEGDLLMANNYSIMHARSTFTDFEEEDRKRHFLRIWLTLMNGRAVPQAYEDTREFFGSYQRKAQLFRK